VGVDAAVAGGAYEVALAFSGVDVFVVADVE